MTLEPSFLFNITCVPLERRTLFNITFQTSCASGTRRFTQHSLQVCCGTAARHSIQNSTTKLLFTVIRRVYRYLTSNIPKQDRCVTPTQPSIQHPSAGPQPSIQHTKPRLVWLLFKKLWHVATHTVLSLEARIYTCNVRVCDTTYSQLTYYSNKTSWKQREMYPC